MTRTRILVLIVAALALGSTLAVAQRDFSKVEIKTTQVAGNVWMLEGAGGNIGVCAGPDGVLMIDDEFAPLTEKIKAAIAAVSDKPIRFLFNTHWHGDHTGGNENFAKLGVVIVAHDNVTRRLGSEQYNVIFDRKTPPSPAAAMPVITFDDSVSFHLNGEDVTCFHVAPAHTDGDAIVWFHNANVVHMGDCLFNGLYPVIDVSSGGRVDGMIAAADRVLPLVKDDTKLIPGHGPLATRADLVAFRDMLVTARDRVKKLVGQKKSLEEIQQAKPLTDLDEKWGKGLTQDVFLKELYLSLTASK